MSIQKSNLLSLPSLSLSVPVFHCLQPPCFILMIYPCKEKKIMKNKKLQYQQLGLFNSLNFPVFRFLLNYWCLLLFLLVSILTHTHTRTRIRLTIRRRGHVVCGVVGMEW